jgi:hypothetical protein
VCDLHQFYLTKVCFLCHRGVSGYPKLSGQVVIQHTITARWRILFCPNLELAIAHFTHPPVRLLYEMLKWNWRKYKPYWNCIEPPTHTITTSGYLCFSFVSSVWKETSIWKRKVMDRNKHEHGNETSNVLCSMKKNKGSFIM